MAETSASVPNAVVTAVPTTGTPPAEGQVRPSGPTKPSLKSEVSNVTGEGENTRKSAQEVADEEFDIDGEKVAKSKLLEDHKRRKEFERASHKRMQEAAEMRKSSAAREAELEAAFNKLNEDPYALYRARGMTDEQIDSIAENRLLQRMKRAQMSPEQIEAEQMRNQYAQMQAEFQRMKQQQVQEQQQALQTKYVEHFDRQIAQAMESGNLPRTASTGAKVAAVMAEYLQAGEMIDPALAAQIVRDGHYSEISHEFSELRNQAKSGRITQDKFIGYVKDLIGEDTVKMIQQSAIKQAQNFEPQKPKTAQNAGSLPKKTFDSFDEANSWISKRINNG